MKRNIIKFMLSTMVFFSIVIQAEETRSEIHNLQTQWAEINYQKQGKEQINAFETLIGEADELIKTTPNSAELYIWRGIIQSTYAGAKGGLGALKFAKASKADLEKALKIDANALQGSAYTSLGTLYFNVPGWPIGFGDDEKAEKMLLKALSINPTGIDPNYFYAQYLFNEGRYNDAKRYYQIALAAPNRDNRPLADSGRRDEIYKALAKVEKRLK